MTITFQRSFHASFYYAMLCQLDLGRDAASLWRPLPPGEMPAYWVEPLLQAYLDAPADLRIQLQVMPLYCDDLDGLLRALARFPAAAGPLLSDLLLVEEPVYEATWRAEEAQGSLRLCEVRDAIIGPLQALREALWQRSQSTPPPLQIFDAPPLGRHGRAVESDGVRRCAVSLAAPIEHVLCQIFHEETHAIADRETIKRWRQRGHDALMQRRDTSAKGTGYELHVEIEQHAIAVGAEVMEGALPGWMSAYERWCEAF